MLRVSYSQPHSLQIWIADLRIRIFVEFKRHSVSVDVAGPNDLILIDKSDKDQPMKAIMLCPHVFVGHPTGDLGVDAR